MLENNSFQVNLFGDFKDIETNSKIIMELMQLFADFGVIPSTFHELNPRQNQRAVARPAFTTPENDFIIEIGSERISVIKNNIENSNIGNIKEFTTNALTILDRIINHFNKKGTRVSLITDSFFPTINSEKLNQQYVKYINPVKYYTENTPFEWKSKSVSRDSYILNGNNEFINVITEVARAQGTYIHSNASFDRIAIRFDINTVFQSNEPRLVTTSLQDFLTSAVETRTKILSQVESIFNE